jgi:hypothetical protein
VTPGRSVVTAIVPVGPAPVDSKLVGRQGVDAVVESRQSPKRQLSPSEVGVIAAILMFLLGIFVPASIMARAYPKRAVRPQLTGVERTLLAYVNPGWTEESGLLRSFGLGVTAGAAAWATAKLRQGPRNPT